ncbi:phosphoribosylformylglycinamidine cyclo-ligase protein [Rutstroemia sp. NJR-2017a WRK4]|nr:phosphoribosylformylglycinamidine cyclo-ligase protein [Rutstroemia sp. NJR-2017a WRK4]
MPYPTRSSPFRTPSPEPLHGKEATTTRKGRFFDVLARDYGTKSLCRISAVYGISEGCGRKWIKQWKEKGNLARKRSRLESKVLGYKSRVSKEIYKMLVSPSRNPLRKHPYEAQIEYFKIPIQKRQLQRKLREYTRGGARYKCAFIKKVISPKNREDRVLYRTLYLYDPACGFFDHIVFTNEVYIDPTSQIQGKWAKAEKLEFYNDEEDKVEAPPYPRKPRRRPKTESEEEYHRRLQEWEAGKLHEQEIKVKDNSITQKYYMERLLPIYCDTMDSIRKIDNKP